MRVGRRSMLGLLAGSAASVSGCFDRAPLVRDAPDPLDRLAPGGHEPDVIRVGVPPTNGHTTAALFAPLVRYLADEQGIRAVVAAADTYEAVAKLMVAGELDAAFFSPLAYVKARATLPAVPVATAARAGSPTYLGYLVVPVDDPAASFSDLRGKRIGYVDRDSASGFLYPRALVRSRGEDPDRFFEGSAMLGDHVSVITAVARGDVEVGATASAFVDPELFERAADVDRIKVVAKTARIPLDCAVVHTGLSRELGLRWRNALLDVVKSLGASDRLSRSWGVSGFVTVDDRHYDDVARVLEGEPLPG